jgi:hypothetical protein
MTSLGRRLEALEETLRRRRAVRLAAEVGIADVDGLLAGLRRLEAAWHRLMAQGLPEAEIRRGLVRWIAADLGLDPDQLEAEWEHDLGRTGRWQAT